MEPSPRRAVLISAGLAAIGLLDAAFDGPLSTQLTFVFFAVVTQLVPIVALTFLPVLNKGLFTALPAFARRRVIGLPLSSLIGAISLLYLLWMIAATFLYPAVGVAHPVGTLILFAVITSSGWLVFLIMRRRRLAEHIDLAKTYAASDDPEDVVFE